MNYNDLDKILGMPLEERKKLQQRIGDEMDDEWIKEIDEQNKIRALEMMEKNQKYLKSISDSLTKIVENTKDISDLCPKEIIFLNYIHKKKTNLSNIAGYWLYSENYHINIYNTIQKFLECGLIVRSDMKYDINKATILELKEYAQNHGIIVKGNKENIINTILNYIEYSVLQNKFGKQYFLRTSKGNDIVEKNKYLLLFHNYGSGINISINDAYNFKNKHPELSEKEAAIKLINNQIEFFKHNNIGTERCYFFISEVYRTFNDLKNQLQNLIVVFYINYKNNMNSIDYNNTEFLNEILNIIEKIVLSEKDILDLIEFCRNEISYSSEIFESFKKDILQHIETKSNYIEIDNAINFLSKYYINNRRKSDVSPYFLNSLIMKFISDIKDNYSWEKEKVIVYILVIDLINDNEMSSYQLSLTFKELGDYYYNNNQSEEAIEMYTRGLNINPKLPVKKKIKELSMK